MILNIFKPKGITSFTLVGLVKRKYNVKKAGHAGTLDPLAEGVLVVLTGDDTKNQDEIMVQDKEYLATITFGITTDTFDLEHLPILTKGALPVAAQLEKTVEDVLPKYVGEYEQQIPNYSAKKIAGKAMYQLAREGSATLDGLKMYKPVNVYEIKPLTYGEHLITTDQGEVKLPFVELKIRCAHGFYVRALANDLGRDIKLGGVLTKLVRSKVGNYSVENAVILE